MARDRQFVHREIRSKQVRSYGDCWTFGKAVVCGGAVQNNDSKHDLQQSKLDLCMRTTLYKRTPTYVFLAKRPIFLSECATLCAVWFADKS
jgi:hypothetical protein